MEKEQTLARRQGDRWSRDETNDGAPHARTSVLLLLLVRVAPRLRSVIESSEVRARNTETLVGLIVGLSSLQASYGND
jgi:hypothetical protein